eukprot:1161501-Pelagomonas_calceolata.AAC.4
MSQTTRVATCPQAVTQFGRKGGQVELQLDTASAISVANSTWNVEAQQQGGFTGGTLLITPAPSQDGSPSGLAVLDAAMKSGLTPFGTKYEATWQPGPQGTSWGPAAGLARNKCHQTGPTQRCKIALYIAFRWHGLGRQRRFGWQTVGCHTGIWHLTLRALAACSEHKTYFHAPNMEVGHKLASSVLCVAQCQLCTCSGMTGTTDPRQKMEKFSPCGTQ